MFVGSLMRLKHPLVCRVHIVADTLYIDAKKCLSVFEIAGCGDVLYDVEFPGLTLRCIMHIWLIALNAQCGSPSAPCRHAQDKPIKA